jgi:chromosome segregation ATPase
LVDGNRDGATVKALLDEVRLLRETLERITLNAYPGQIVFERLRAQHERVARLGSTLEDTRDELASLGANVKGLGERSEALAEHVRAHFEAEQREFKYALDQLRQRQDRLPAREAQLTAELQGKQAKLADLEGRLEALEREIEKEIERQRARCRTKQAPVAPTRSEADRVSRTAAAGLRERCQLR